MADSAPKKKKFRKFHVNVTRIIRETHDTSTLILDTDEERDYKAGQFISIDPNQFVALERWCTYLAEQKGRREPPRQYSLGSAPYEAQLTVTIKEETYDAEHDKYPPLLSPYLAHRIPEGTRMEVMGYAGPYSLPDDIEDKTDTIYHINSGSGVVPNYGIIKQKLHEESPLKHVMVYGNKTYDDIIYREAFDELAQQHPEKFSILHCISREESPETHGAHYRKGRVTQDLLAEVIQNPSEAYVYACGAAISPWAKKAAKETGIEPKPQFMEGILTSLDALGVPKTHIHKESW